MEGLKSIKDLHGATVLLRLDWNIPLHKKPVPGDLLKIQDSIETIRQLCKQKCKVVVLTHLGRPKTSNLAARSSKLGRKIDKNYSTARLLPLVEMYLEKPIHFCGENLTNEQERLEALKSIQVGKPGSVFLLENVRFYPGEETNDPALAKAYASLGEVFVNDAFASCHRQHVSVVGIAKLLPSAAGPQLIKEIEAADKVLKNPKKPFVLILGGAKLETKMPVIASLLPKADKILIGGAMANAFFAAKKLSLGKSLADKESIKLAKALKSPKIILPEDVLVAKKIALGAKPKCVAIKQISKTDMIGDIGVKTMRSWSQIIKSAKTILWNGPLGVTEIPAFSHGSLVIAQAVAMRSKGKAFGLVGGGDTVPVVIESGMSEWIDHISMGGGALLEYIGTRGKLPGIIALTRPTSHVPRPTSKKTKTKRTSSKAKRRSTK
ncbi:MAG: phosphoglycerate kinase [Patescibacteria group bacterium]